MSILGTVFSVGTTALLLASGNWGSGPLAVVLTNRTGGPLFIAGTSAVGTTGAAQGYTLPVGSSTPLLLLHAGDDLYGVCAPGTSVSADVFALHYAG